MIKKYIWDTGALSIFFAGNKMTKQKYKEIIKKKALGYVPTLVLSEFYYKSWQKFGQQAAEMRTISVSETMEELTLEIGDKFDVGELKVKNPELSIVDAVIMTLADRVGATILTTDGLITKEKGYSSIKLDF